eukprot:CAMPEP_0184655824 /NCGR_PEP_ID=MMETSP0308-20130426/14518_1 /TAXON_ID=38269 /ORGANISM="Gloeochaete witrockiana, Strain SAG 46.84" /LENGTH=91 /DNA_ID=CAMNT_0027092585 /DNA_START=147 /DNA_END=422 /DNA_ORIENTATION=+
MAGVSWDKAVVEYISHATDFTLLGSLGMSHTSHGTANRMSKVPERRAGRSPGVSPGVSPLTSPVLRGKPKVFNESEPMFPEHVTYDYGTPI